MAGEDRVERFDESWDEGSYDGIRDGFNIFFVVGEGKNC